jgi:hypothetical protein
MLATALVLAAGAYLPNGTYAYVCAQYGRVNEQSSIAVEHRRTGIVIREKTSGSFGEINSLATDLLVLGGDLTPARYDGVYRVRGRTLAVVTRLRQFVYLGTHAWPPPGWLSDSSARNLRS